MEKHSFLLTPGRWLGEGKIKLSMIEEELAFLTRWKIEQDDLGGMECVQEIQVKGLSEVMINHFHLFDQTAVSFSLFMESHVIGRVQGIGIINENVIGWEFRSEEVGFEGFELYEKQSDDLYHVKGEFSSSDQFRTSIQGKIWKQSLPSLGEKLP